MAISFSTKEFPDSVSMKDNSGLPWGCIVQPFNAAAEFVEPPPLSLVARCDACFAYINPYCRVDRSRWKCSLCRNTNSLSDRYKNRHTNAEEYPELQRSVVEYEFDEIQEGKQSEFAEYIVYLAAVDLTGSDAYLDAVKSALLATLEALPANSLFGLVTFSRSLGLYDLRTPYPHVRNIFLPADEECSLGLEEVMTLETLVVQIAANKDNIVRAIDSLCRCSPLSDVEKIQRAKLGIPRGFGSTMNALVDYIAAYNKSIAAHVSVYIAGIPNHGLGTLDPTKLRSFDDPPASTPQTAFYEKLASKAAIAGIRIDLYALSTFGPMDLASFSCLANATGGNLMYYESVASATLPQDVFRHLSTRLAYQGYLRIRTSPEFSIGAAYGPLSADKEIENLYHLASMDDFKCVAFDFDFNSANGFTHSPDETPIVQVAFAYTCIRPDSIQPGTEHLPPVTIRKLRVMTVSTTAARSIMSLYESSNPDIILSLLTHKIQAACLEQGAKEARHLLQDWLVTLCAHYNMNFDEAGNLARKASGLVDVEFATSHTLTYLPKLVYGLWRSPLLRPDSAIASDLRAFHMSLFSFVEPKSLALCLYPSIVSLTSAEEVCNRNLPLSQRAIQTCADPIYLLDVYHSVFLFYKTKENVVFPPAQDSKLHKQLNKSKQGRLVSVNVSIVAQGDPQERAFWSCMIEDDNDSITFETFLAMLQKEVPAVMDQM
eukprot:GILJ01009428.1.p1 GENE.GILJ01009428.1~~GILJ01009428.1.p1  ORF type:complete len:715 (+),score=92.37 GILJ01009428.1:45-2189(+)